MQCGTVCQQWQGKMFSPGISSLLSFACFSVAEIRLKQSTENLQTRYHPSHLLQIMQACFSYMLALACDSPTLTQWPLWGNGPCGTILLGWSVPFNPLLYFIPRSAASNLCKFDVQAPSASSWQAHRGMYSSSTQTIRPAAERERIT